jgi:hypothetical protein
MMDLSLVSSRVVRFPLSYNSLSLCILGGAAVRSINRCLCSVRCEMPSVVVSQDESALFIPTMSVLLS